MMQEKCEEKAKRQRTGLQKLKTYKKLRQEHSNDVSPTKLLTKEGEGEHLSDQKETNRQQ